MLTITRHLLVLILSISTAHAAAEGITPGYYETPEGSGHLTIQRINSGKFSFAIETVGVNGHSCSLEGFIVGARGTIKNDDSPKEPCIVDFEPADPHGVDVSTSTPESCKNFCGMRANFEGDYQLPPAGCGQKERSVRRATFLQQYRARQYQLALATLGSFYRDCSKSLTWVEIDEVRNDLAITQYHLGKFDECLTTLSESLAIAEKYQEELNALLPGDADVYGPVETAAKHNYQLCKQARESKPGNAAK
jgi:hypothetical protein